VISHLSKNCQHDRNFREIKEVVSVHNIHVYTTELPSEECVHSS